MQRDMGEEEEKQGINEKKVVQVEVREERNEQPSEESSIYC